jgi:hypothetical protein
MDSMRKVEHLKMAGVKLKIEPVTSEIRRRSVMFSVPRDK